MVFEVLRASSSRSKSTENLQLGHRVKGSTSRLSHKTPREATWKNMKQPRMDNGAGYGHFCKSTRESPWVEKTVMRLNMLWKKYGVIPVYFWHIVCLFLPFFPILMPHHVGAGPLQVNLCCVPAPRMCRTSGRGGKRFLWNFLHAGNFSGEAGIIKHGEFADPTGPARFFKNCGILDSMQGCSGWKIPDFLCVPLTWNHDTLVTQESMIQMQLHN